MYYTKKIIYLFVFIAISTAASGCASLLPEAHKIDVHQGNIVDNARIKQLKPGMSREQVKYLLGSPASNNLFHADRWDYLHYTSKAGSHAKPKRITVFFENGIVSKVENQYAKE